MKEFKDFLKSGVVKKKTPDESRAQNLIAESNRKNNFLVSVLENIGVNDNNANDIIENSYDVIIGLIRAKMLSEGFSASGFSAHEAEVSFLGELDFLGEEILFLNQLRYFRNGMLYYGKRFDKEYAEKVLGFLKKVRVVLK